MLITLWGQKVEKQRNNRLLMKEEKISLQEVIGMPILLRFLYSCAEQKWLVTVTDEEVCGHLLTGEPLRVISI